MCDVVVHEASEEVAVVASVLEQLTRDGDKVGQEHVASLVHRLRSVAGRLDTCAQTTATASAEGREGSGTRADATSATCTAATAPQSSASRKPRQRAAVVTKPSSVSAVRVPRASPPRDAHSVASDVTRVLTSSLYNVLESLTRLLTASRASVLVRRGDDMVAIVNVAAHLQFPPQLARHRCAGAADAEVLASGIALNQHTTATSSRHGGGGGGDGSKGGTSQPRSWLLFPVHAPGRADVATTTAIADDTTAVAVLSIEDKARGTRAFDAHDEAFAYLASLLIGELLTRVRDFDWVAHYYDPVTQHIVAPFTLPPACVDGGALTPRALPPLPTAHGGGGGEAVAREEMARRLAQHRPEVLIRRQAVSPNGRLVATAASSSPIAHGLTPLPSLREVNAYVANMQHCWKTSVTSNVALMEGGREMQNELRTLRRTLAETQTALSQATQRLRLYELDTTDYSREYKDLRVELDAFFGKATSSAASSPTSAH